MPTKLGQNFLNDPAVLEKIIQASNLKNTDVIIEIGPGKGVLTEQLADKAGQVIAIELDSMLVPDLEEKFSGQKNVSIIQADILKINLPELLKTVETRHRLVSTAQTSTTPIYKVIANIPYYITSPIIRLFLEQENQPQEMLLMVQKEVAQRITATAGQMSILAISVQYYAKAEIAFEVSKNAFLPIPRVDSAVIKFLPHKKFDKEMDKKFFRVVRAGFSAKRKTLLNNLSNGLQLDKAVVLAQLKALSLGENARAQELDIATWKKLSTALSFRA